MRFADEHGLGDLEGCSGLSLQLHRDPDGMIFTCRECGGVWNELNLPDDVRHMYAALLACHRSEIHRLHQSPENQ